MVSVFQFHPQGYFEDDTITAVKKLLPESADGDLADFCSWPDEIKHLSQWKWTSVLHYVNTPEYRCNYEYCRVLSFPPTSYMFSVSIVYVICINFCMLSLNLCSFFLL